MDTSLRYGGASKTLRIHAKEKFSLAPQIFLQGHAEIDTALGAPSCLAVLIRHLYPQVSASTCVGLQYDGKNELSYNIRGKKAFPITSNGLWNLNVKGRCDVDKEFKERKARLAAELTWGILNFQKDQDLRLKVGYEVFDKVPYFQLRENCWTFNIDTDGKWSVSVDVPESSSWLLP